MTEEKITSILESLDIRINGSRPWDVQVHNQNLWRRVCHQGNLGLGEAYMEGWWDCQALDQLFDRVLRADLEKYFTLTLPVLWEMASYAFRNLQNVHRAFMVGQKHYDFGNDMFEAILDPYMQYSCGYWEKADTLEQAQQNKLELICRKLHLEPGHKVLDIGCGWGGLARYMAEKYAVEVTGITVSKEQASYATAHSGHARVRFLLEDYRQLQGRFDRIVSVGMFEHVGHKNYRTYMEGVHNLLAEDGLFLLHTIGANTRRYSVDPWIEKYIFRNGILPCITQMGTALSGRFVMEDWHNFGADYDKTLMAWSDNFRRGYEEKRFVCPEKTYRMFQYYLLSCAGAFRARDIQLWQIMLSPHGVRGGYRRPGL